MHLNEDRFLYHTPANSEKSLIVKFMYGKG